MIPAARKACAKALWYMGAQPPPGTNWGLDSPHGKPHKEFWSSSQGDEKSRTDLMQAFKGPLCQRHKDGRQFDTKRTRKGTLASETHTSGFPC